MRGIISGRRGQSLIVVVAAVLVLLALFAAVVETGNLMYEKVHIQNAADSAAMEAGLWYARSMNLASLSNKVLGLSALVAVIGTFLGCPELLKGPEYVIKLQDALAGTGKFEGKSAMAWLCCLMAVRNGKLNGAVVAPLFNPVDCPTLLCLPGLNLERYTPDKAAEQETKYYYTKKSTGEKVYVDTQDTVLDPSIKNRKDMEGRVKARKGMGEASNKYLKKEVPSAQEKIPFLLRESSDEHAVLIPCWKEKPKQLLGSGLLKDDDGNETAPVMLFTFSFVRVSGGTMDLFDLNGANYGARLEHVQLPGIEGLKDAGGAMSQLPENAGGEDAMDKLGDWLDSVEFELILH